MNLPATQRTSRATATTCSAASTAFNPRQKTKTSFAQPDAWDEKGRGAGDANMRN